MERLMSRFFAYFLFSAFTLVAGQFVTPALGSVPGDLGCNDAPQLENVQGGVHFELRHTIVPLVIVQGGSAPRSQPYWSLVVTSNGTDYEVNQQFNMGQEQAPEQIELEKVKIPAGSVISLQGEVQYTSDHFVLFKAVKNVALVRKDYQVILPARQPIDDAFANWTCTGQLNESTQVFADVWYDSSTEDLKGTYVVRLSGANTQNGSREIYQIAYIDSVDARSTGEASIFEGKDAQTSISLTINDSDNLVQTTGTMKLSTVEASSSAAVESTIDVNCNRNR